MGSISPDSGALRNTRVHEILLGANIWIIENLANVDALPESGYDLYNMVYKLKDGSGAPSRVFAMPSNRRPRPGFGRPPRRGGRQQVRVSFE